MPELLLNLEESAPRLRVSATTLRRLIKSRKIPYRKIGRRFFLTDKDINEFLDNVFYPMERREYENT